MKPERIDVDISGFGLRFEGLPSDLAHRLGREWPAYVSADALAPSLVIRVEDAGRAMRESRFMDGSLRMEPASGGVRFGFDEGEIELAASGAQAIARLASGDAVRRLWGLINLACVAVGWRLLSRGGAALHAAAAIVDGRAYVMVGPSGCGKTTWARTAAEAGLGVLSDDCVLLETRDGHLESLGSPFRSTEFPSPGPGRWPVGAILLPDHAPAPALTQVSPLILEARIAANMLFAVPAWETGDAAVAAGLIARGAPARMLSFRPDGSWIPLLREIGDHSAP